MRLDYDAVKRRFILRVPRGEYDPLTLMTEHGLDFSATNSTPAEAVLFTSEPYAAVPFFKHASEAARAVLLDMHNQIDTSWAISSGAHIKVPADQELADFQKAGVEYALRRTNTLIGDQPGLGKTMQAIAFCNEVSARRVLVICPANIRLQWYQRIREWSTMELPVIYPILKGGHGVHPNAEWTIVSYDLARTEAIWRALAKGLYDVLILDEGHYLKTIDARRTRAVFGGGLHPVAEALAGRAGAILALTGTPLPNRPREAYTLARGLCWDAIDWFSEDEFTHRFNPSMKGETAEGKIYIDERSGRHSELQARLRANFMVRRLKRVVQPQLKLPVFDIVQMDETGPVKQALKAESLLDIDPENLEGADISVLGHIAVVRRMMGIALAPQVADYVETVLDGGEDKVLLFGWHIEVLDILTDRLAKYGIRRVDGRVTPTRKELFKQQFIKDPSIRVFLGNIQSIGTGTDGVQAVASHAIFAESDWVPGNNEQAVDRLDRMGQKRTVLADFCVAPGSISEKVLASALRKRKTTHLALDAIY